MEFSYQLQLFYIGMYSIIVCRYRDRFNNIQILYKRMQAQIFGIPSQMSSISTATVLQTANGEVLICHDDCFLYATKMARTGGNVIFQKFNLPSVISVLPIIKNYFLVLFATQKLVVFEVGFGDDGKVMLKFIYNKDRQYISYFLREVVDNMAELQVFYPDNEVHIYQFTVKGKIGNMTYTFTNQNKVKSCDRQQLYGSKTMLSLHKKALYSFANFSNKFVGSQDLQKLEMQLFKQYTAYPIAYICLSKIQEFYVVLSNLYVVNCVNASQRHKIMCDMAHLVDIQKLCAMKNQEKQTALRITTYLDCLLIEDLLRETTYVFQIKQKGSSLVGVERGRFNWFWTSSRRLIGLSVQRSLFKILDSIRLSPQINAEKMQEVIDSPKSAKNSNEKSSFRLKIQGESPQKQGKSLPDFFGDGQEKQRPQFFKVDEPMVQIPEQQQPKQEEVVKPAPIRPNRIIQKNKVSVSKIVSKSREIEPISNNPVVVANQEWDQPNEGGELSKKAEQSIPKEVIKQEEKKEDSKRQDQEGRKLEDASLKVQEQQKDQVKQSQNKQEEDIAANSNEDFKAIQNLLQQQNVRQSKGNGIAQGKQHSQQASSKTQQKLQIKLPQYNPFVQLRKDHQPQLPKSHALLMGKLVSVGVPIDPFNIFNSSINRNNIFQTSINRNNIFSFNRPWSQSSQSLFPFKKHQSKKHTFAPNHFIPHPPFPSPSVPPLPDTSRNNQSEDVKINNQPQEIKDNEEIICRVKRLFQQTTAKLLKSLQELGSANTIEPYIRQKLKQQLNKKILQSLKLSLTGDFTNRLELFFNEIFKQTNQVQEQSIKFYKEASLHKSTCIEVQLTNQQKILKQIKDIEGMMKFCMQNMKRESLQSFQNMVRDWNKNLRQANNIVNSLAAIKDKLENQENLRTKRYEETKTTLDSIKQLLIERVNIEEAKKQKRIEKEAARLLQQKKKRKERNKKAKSKGIENDRTQKYKVKKQSEND